MPHDYSEDELYLGERCYPGHLGITEEEAHRARYRLAAELVVSGICFDVSCGSGYGTKILASNQNVTVFGGDISDHALAYAKQYFSGPNIQYLKIDLERPLPFHDNLFDSIVSFETIEHLENQTGFLRELFRVLKKGGVMMVSTPDKNAVEQVLQRSDKGDSRHHFHKKELEKKEFIELLEGFFYIRSLFGQGQLRVLKPYEKLLRRCVSIAMAVDVLKLRRRIPKAVFRSTLNHIEPVYERSAIRRIDENSPNIFLNIIAVCVKE